MLWRRYYQTSLEEIKLSDQLKINTSAQLKKGKKRMTCHLHFWLISKSKRHYFIKKQSIHLKVLENSANMTRRLLKHKIVYLLHSRKNNHFCFLQTTRKYASLTLYLQDTLLVASTKLKKILVLCAYLNSQDS